ncbi:hypothetical protein [Streptomyces erythrochromogenes]|uniref:hypothetical protein n=1 Tax=Streptomyces erythrochromogenes TaxID=285574 RepID=UPI0036B4C6EE
MTVTQHPHNPGWDRPKLAAAREEVVELFTGSLGYQLLPGPESDPTRHSLMAALLGVCSPLVADPVTEKDILAVYLTCHGIIHEGTGEHLLITSDINPQYLGSSLSTRELATMMLRGTRVRQLLLMLDTCQSGAGGNEVAAAALSGLTSMWGQEPEAGMVVIASAQPSEEAATGVFPHLLRQAVTVAQAARPAADRLDPQALVREMNQLADRPGHMRIGLATLAVTGAPPPFFPSRPQGRLAADSGDGPAARLLAEAERLSRAFSESGDRARALRLVVRACAPGDPDRAERVARTMPEDCQERCEALLEVAAVVADADAERAARLLAEAEQAARALTMVWSQARALRLVVRACAPGDPDRAERVARTMPDDRGERCEALLEVAAVVADADAERAARLRDVAEGVATASASPQALVDVAKAVSAIDPGRACRLLQQATDRVMPRADFDGRIPDNGPATRDIAIVAAEAVRLVGEDRAHPCVTAAERVIEACTCEDCRLTALVALGRARAKRTPGSAARFLESALTLALSDLGQFGPEALEIADALRPTDPERAERIEADALRAAEASASTGFVADRQRRAAAVTLGPSAPDRAERLAWAISDQYQRTQTLAGLAAALSTADPQRAVSLALSMDDELPKALTLAALAEATDDADLRTRLLAEGERSTKRISAQDRVPALLALAKAYEA